jgi:hypothetical protein
MENVPVFRAIGRQSASGTAGDEVHIVAIGSLLLLGLVDKRAAAMGVVVSDKEKIWMLPTLLNEETSWMRNSGVGSIVRQIS